MPYEDSELDPRQRFKQILKESYVDPTKEIEYPPVAISMGSTGATNQFPICVGTYGNFSFIQAPPKSRKTFLVSLLVSAYLSTENDYAYGVKGHSDGRSVLHYDTEQGDFHAQRVFKRVHKMSDSPTNYMPYCLREYSFKERLEFIDWHLYQVKDLGLVIIDGIADLVADVNDINQSNELVQYLMRWTKELQIHIITVIHSNYNSTKPTGHLGSFLEKKTETQISVSIEEENDAYSVVKCVRSRSQPFDSFQFQIINGYPHIVKPLDDKMDGERYIDI